MPRLRPELLKGQLVPNHLSIQAGLARRKPPTHDIDWLHPRRRRWRLHAREATQLVNCEWVKWTRDWLGAGAARLPALPCCKTLLHSHWLLSAVELSCRTCIQKLWAGNKFRSLCVAHSLIVSLFLIWLLPHSLGLTSPRCRQGLAHALCQSPQRTACPDAGPVFSQCQQ